MQAPARRATQATVVTPDALRRAVKGAELVLHYQPKIDLRSHRVVGVEALVRWQPPGGALVYPDSFIPLAEELGLMPALTASVLDEALDQYVAWRDAGLHLKVAVNVPASLLSNPRAVPHLGEALARRSVTPAALTLEVTESVVMDDVETSLHTLRLFREMGVSLSIDDFGTGYSSLSYLSRLPVTELKIDRSFVTALADHENNRAIVRSTVGLGHGFGHSVVAEGVEDLATYVLLHRSGCDVGQGYYMSRPLPPDRLGEWLAVEWPERALDIRRALTGGADRAGVEEGPAAHDALLRAYQQVIASDSVAEVARVLVRFVESLGGTTVGGADLVDDTGVLPLDISLGEGEPLLPVAAASSRARRHLDAALPVLMHDARRMAHLLRAGSAS